MEDVLEGGIGREGLEFDKGVYCSSQEGNAAIVVDSNCTTGSGLLILDVWMGYDAHEYCSGDGLSAWEITLIVILSLFGCCGLLLLVNCMMDHIRVRRDRAKLGKVAQFTYDPEKPSAGSPAKPEEYSQAAPLAPAAAASDAAAKPTDAAPEAAGMAAAHYPGA